MLPDGLVVSTKLFWPPNRRKEELPKSRKRLKWKPPKLHNRLPEIVILAAVANLLADDGPLVSAGWDDSKLAKLFAEWLQTRGAKFESGNLVVTSDDMSKLRTKFKNSATDRTFLAGSVDLSREPSISAKKAAQPLIRLMAACPSLQTNSAESCQALKSVPGGYSGALTTREPRLRAFRCCPA